jgi:plastocyanin
VLCAGVSAAVVHAARASSASKPETVAVTVGPSGNKVFSPAIVKPHLGDTVTWTWGSSHHTSTDATGLGLWSSGILSAGATFSYTFTHAGAYAYECTLHASSGMTGLVRVPVKITKTSATDITLTWASAAPPANFVEDVQEKASGAAKFTTIVSGSADQSAPLTLTTGTWHFRARYRSTIGNSTAWSPAATVAIS